MKRRRKFLIIIVLLLLSVALLLFFTDLYLIGLGPLDVGVTIPAEYGDVILVLGGGLRPRVLLGYSTEERLHQAVALYRQKARFIILADGSLYKNSPAIPKLLDFFKRMGVKRDHVLFEARSRNTFASCLNSRQLIMEKGFDQVVVCTSPYHQRRTATIMRHVGFSDFMIARMNESEIYQSASLRQRLRNLRLIFREYFALLKFSIIKR